jgi:hypothetical protein
VDDVVTDSPNKLYRDITINEAAIADLPENDVPASVWETSFRCIDEVEKVDPERASYLTTYVRERPSGVFPVQPYRAACGGNTMSDVVGEAKSDDSSSGSDEGASEDEEVYQDGSRDAGIVSTGIVDSNGTGVTARHVKRRVFQKLFSLKVGVGNNPVSEFDELGLLLARAFPVLFPYGVGAPGSLVHRPSGCQPVRLAEHAKFLMEHSDSRFAGHRMFSFALVNMIQRHAACYAAKAIASHRDIGQLRTEIDGIDEEDMNVAVHRLDNGAPMDQVMQSLPEGVRRILSKISIIGHTVPGSPHARRKLLPQLLSMINTLGPPTLFITINPHDFGSPIVMNWATGKGDLDLQEPLRGVPLERLKVVAEHPGLAAQFFHEMCVAFQDIILGAANHGVGIFGKTSGFYGVSEAQGRGTLHCHYVVWLDGAGTSDGIKHAIDVEGESGPFRRKLVEFFDAVVCSTFRSMDVDGRAGAPDPAYCRPPDLGIPMFDRAFAEYKDHLQEDAECVARKSNMHNPTHTFTCFKGNKKVCRFGFPKEEVEESRYDDTHGLVGSRGHPWLNSFNLFMASTLRCNHDIK